MQLRNFPDAFRVHISDKIEERETIKKNERQD